MKWQNYKPDDLWYLVGLITADGSLSKDKRHVALVSKDYDFLKAIKKYYALDSKVGIVNRDKKNQAYRLQMSSKPFYEFLLSIGLMANKSLSLSSLTVDEKYISFFLRGLIDGDGNIRRWNHSRNSKEQWSLRIYSGSRKFLEWLQTRVETCFAAKGRIHSNKTKNVFVLKYGKLAAQIILKNCYLQRGLKLKRKFELAKACVSAKAKWTKSPTTKARVVELVDTRDSGIGSPLW